MSNASSNMLSKSTTLALLLLATLFVVQPVLAQNEDPVLDHRVTALVDEALAAPHPENSADKLWQACAAAHGEIQPLLRELRARISKTKAAGARRLICGVMRYEGRPHTALRELDGIPVKQRTNADLLLRAELLDTISRGDEAARSYDELLKRELEPELKKRILFRRALVGSDSIEQLQAFAKSEGNTREQRNQAATILALRNEPKAALELYEVHGEGTVRFRQLVRLAEWALAAEAFEKAQEFAWEAVQVAKMKRDRRYALTVVVSAYRVGKATDALLKRLEQSPDLKDDARQVWIDLLRDEGRVDDALRLFQEGKDGEWTPALRRQLLEICRETGREEVLIDQFRKLMAAEPDNLEWRSGLSRHFLENGDREQAQAVWQDFGGAGTSNDRQLEAAYALMDLGLDELALRAANTAAKAPNLVETAKLFIVKLFVDRGRFDEASATLKVLEEGADGRDAVLAEVAGIYERMDRLDRAVDVLDRMRDAFGGFLGTDLDMKYALLLSKVNREHDALKVWRSLWTKVRSTPRGRYVEDRMMTVAARLGVLAKIAIELEDKLDAGTADTTDVELLVRLYVKVGDSAAATEITEDSLRTSKASDIDIIRRKATIYLACHDYLEYETLIEKLIELDPENRLDHMRELTLSRLERGRRAQAIEKLPELRAASDDSGIADEFEAGIYQLAGLKEPALKSYVKGLGRFPDRIDTHLLVANLMRETGREMDAARRFQYLAATAKRDDLFTIAIDGILNLRAQDDTQVPQSVVEWAMRVTLERLAERSHRFYLHRLAADLAEEMNDMPMAIRTLTAGIPVAGERRTALLREILGKLRSLDRNARVMFAGSRGMRISPDWDAKPYVMIGRRLLGQGEVVPPQVFMDLAAVFLHVKAVPDAMRTFSRAAELLDRSEVHRQAAAVLEEAARYDAALQFYRRLLSVDANDVTLLVKIGRLEELAGRDEAARKVYEQGLAVALKKRAIQVHVATEETPDPDDIMSVLGRQRSVDSLTSAWPKLIEGLLVTMTPADAKSYVQAMQADVLQDIAAFDKIQKDKKGTSQVRIDEFPRLAARADALRRICLCYRMLPISDAIDGELLKRFSTDRDLAKASIGYRAARGFQVSAAKLASESEFRTDPDFAALVQVDIDDGPVAPEIAAARVVSLLVEDPAAVRTMLENIDASAFEPGNLDSVPVLMAACALSGATDAGERIARAGVRIAAGLSQRDQVLLGRRSSSSFRKLAARIDPSLERELLDYQLQRTVVKGAKALLSMQYEVDGEKDLKVDVERVEQMLRNEVANSAQEQFGLRSMPLMFFLPEERRAGLLRELYTAAPSSQRLRVLADGSDFVEEPLTDAYVKWFHSAFEREYGDADKRARRGSASSYRQSGSRRLLRARLETARKLGGGHREWLQLLQVMAQLKDFEAAHKALEEGIPDLLSRDDLAGIVPNRPKELDTRQITEALKQLHAFGLQDKVAEIVEAKLAATPRHEALLFAQWHLRTAMPGAAEFVAAQTKKGADTKEQLERSYQFAYDRGRLVEARDTIKLLIEKDKKRAAMWRNRMASLEAKLGNPEAAAKLRGQRTAKAPSAAGSAVATLVQAFSVSGRAVQVAKQAARPNGNAKPRKPGDPKSERLKLRRRWRGKGNDRIIYSPLFPRANVSISKRDVENLKGEAYAESEVRSMLRLLEDAGQLGADSLLAALLQALPVDEDVAATCQRYLKEISEGQGGTAESMHLLVLLATAELAGEVRQEAVQTMIARRVVPDAAQMRTIANELCDMDKREAAAALYRLSWLADQDGGSAVVYRGQRQSPTDIIADVEKRLGESIGKQTAILMLDDLLATGETPDVMLAALDLWSRLLEPAELAARVAALHARMVKVRNEPRMSYMFQNKSAELSGAFCASFAEAGQVEQAVTEWRHVVCAPLPDAYGRTPRRNERSLKQAITKLLAAKWDGSEQWLRAAGEAVVAWQDQGMLDLPVAVLGPVGVRMGEAGHKDLAEACAAHLGRLAPDNTYAEQQWAYAKRAAGDNDGAWQIEKKLLAKRRLAIADHVRVLKELQEREGAAIAYAEGQKTLTYTSHTDVLTLLVSLAKELGDDERATGWQKTIDSRKPKKVQPVRGAEPKR